MHSVDQLGEGQPYLETGIVHGFCVLLLQLCQRPNERLRHL